MINEQTILDAVDYILISLNNIKNYKNFIEYKEEFKTALLDIKKFVENLKNNNNLKYNKENHSNLDTAKDKDNTSYLSSMLGLKFNYDEYFDKNQLKNLTENEKNVENNLIKNNNNYIKINNNKSNKSNINYIKSIRNKFRNNNNIIQDNNRNINRINQNQTFNNISPTKSKTNKEKLSVIVEIVSKMNNEDYIYEILTKLYGDDLTEKLMSYNVSDELLESIQNSIKEIETLIEKDPVNMNSKMNYENKNKNFHINKYNIKNKNNYKRSISSKKLNVDTKKNNIYKEFNFVKSLRKNGKIQKLENNENNIVLNRNNVKKERPFINATNPYGNYFDAPLQNGGLSKLGKPY